jgi:putative MFS transporter
VISAWREARSLLDRQHWVLLALLGTTCFFEGFDRTVVQIALPQIRESFGLSQAGASLWLTPLFLGALPSLFLARRADRVGRRRMLVIAVVGYTVFTGLTALAPNVGTFTAMQFMARFFMYAESAIVVTMAAEELPAGARGFGFGMLAMLDAIGVGLAAILYGGVFEPNGISWRWMFVVGIPALLFVAYMRRRLPESRRFTAAASRGQLASHWRAILQPPHRRWFVLVVAAAFFSQLLTHAGVFTIDFLQTDRGYSVTASNFMLILAGLPGIPLMVLAGSLSDRYGRRVIGCSFGALAIFGVLCFFWLPGHIYILVPAMTLVLVGGMSATPVLSTYGTELFPTSLRGQAGSWTIAAKLSGQAASLALGGVLVAATGSLSWSATILAGGPLFGIVLFLVFFPDTHGRELEDIAPDEVIAEDLAAEVLFRPT